MNYKISQKKFDEQKWKDSILAGKDTCGTYEFCSACDKTEENPCAKAKFRIKEKVPKTKVASCHTKKKVN